jgi:putative oxidoreductase
MRVRSELNLRVLLRWLLGILLVWAALSKLGNLQDFLDLLLGYKLPGPHVLFKIVTIILPWLELLCGLMLLARVHLRAALLWSIILFALFAVFTGQAWARGLNISCGCFNLDLFGLDPTSMGGFLESAAFACIRSVMLCGAALFLFRTMPPEFPPQIDNAGGATSESSP